MKVEAICKILKPGFSIKSFRFDILDVGFIILLGMMTYQGQAIQAVCATGYCGF
ncbi:MAG TPA: hypothetical protein VFG25_07240 [Nitrosopumilaceae archaeon]|nr:hypothetical protein [Nitrosopumilaceae archaeon]